MAHLDDKTQIKLKQAGINFPDDVFTTEDSKLNAILESCSVNIVRLRKLAASEYEFKFVTAKELLKEESAKKNFTTGCMNFDEILQGGIPKKGITEISGESSTGKTQLCLQFSITSQLSHDGKFPGVLYISTECQFPTNRLQQIIERMLQRIRNIDGEQSLSQVNLIEGTQFSDQIYLQYITTVETLLHCLKFKVQHLLASNRVNLIIIDSIAALFRSDYDMSLISSVKQRTNDIVSIAKELNSINERNNIPIICVNQVSDVFTSNAGVQSSKFKTQPSLGLVWSNLITTRILLSKTTETITMKDAQFPVKTLEVVYSPYITNRSCRYVIDTDGVKVFPPHKRS